MSTYDNEAALILSPFDNIMRERHRPRKMWGFEYKLEAYVPAAKRVYGYHVLPILDDHKLVGRMPRDIGMMDCWKSRRCISRKAVQVTALSLNE